MTRSDALAYYLTLTALQRALVTQLTLLRENLRIMVRLGAPAAARRLMASEIQRVSLEQMDIRIEIRELADSQNFPLPPALRD